MSVSNAWLKFGCFITGYNYNILKSCSEVAKKTVKRYTAAMVIMCLLWGVIGYSFASRYLNASLLASSGVSLLFILVIIQIERQIILQTHKNNLLQFFRGVIAVMMALIGSLIVDQIIFKDDIELQKEQFINRKVEKIYPERAAIRQKQISQLQTQLLQKDSQRAVLNKDLQDHPLITSVTTDQKLVPVTTSETNPDGTKMTRTRQEMRTTVQRTEVENPNKKLLPAIDSQITALQRIIIAQGDSLATLRVSIEKVLKEKTGFLDELNIMFSLLAGSAPALVVYLVWFLLLLGLECFILMNKRHEEPTDYDAMINHQMETHKKKLQILSPR